MSVSLRCRSRTGNNCQLSGLRRIMSVSLLVLFCYPALQLPSDPHSGFLLYISLIEDCMNLSSR